MARIIPPNGYLLIVTYGRSGSTLLQTVLQSIDGYCIRGENKHILRSLFEAYDRAKFARKKFGGGKKAEHRPWFGADKIRPEMLGKRLVNTFIDEVLRPDKDARAVGFKEIRYYEGDIDDFPDFMDFILKFFPSCRIIFNTRNVDDVAVSKWMKSPDSKAIIEKIPLLDQAFADYQSNHPNNCFLLNYDSYKNNVDGLRPLFDFLGETFSAERLQAVLDRQLTH